MVTSMDIGNFFIELSLRTGMTDLTNMKLNKLVYFAQAWSLAKLGHPLFNEDVQAWAYGPVIPKIYHAFKIYENRPITKTLGNFNIKDLSPEEMELIGDVYLKYGSIRPTDLVWKTHEIGSPWQQVYLEGVYNRKIPQELMGEYYRSRQDELKLPQINLEKIPRVGFRDADGRRVFPVDMDCPEDDVFDQMYAKGL